MKKIFLLLLIVVFASSCAPSFLYSPQVYYLDYSFFKERNFFITETNTVSFPYESLGSVSVVIRSGYTVKKTNKTGNIYKYNKLLAEKKGDFIDASIDDVYQLVYDAAKEKGANGILGFKIEYLKPEKFKGNKSNYGYQITGMAIKK